MCCGDCKARCTPRGRGGFTLIEMVVTMGVLALVMTVMTSIMLATAKAMPSAADADVALDADDRALREAAWLVADAKQITSNSPNKLGFRVGDVDKDGGDDEVTLTHGGNAGESLIMTCAGSEVELVQNVRTFTFEFQTGMVAGTTVSGTYDTSEMLLDGWNGPVTDTRKVRSLSVVGMRLAPVLPADATAFRVTRMRVYVKPNNNGDAFMRWQLMDPSSDMPNLTAVRASVDVNGRIAVAGDWTDVSFAGNTYWHAANERPFLLASAQTFPLLHEFEIGCTTLAPHAGNLWDSASMLNITNAAMLYEVYGVVRRPQLVPSTKNVARAMTVLVERVDGTTVQVTVPMRNEPEVP
jgi:prepilin-type N-terminal cleavage/methylation domain-containing protein